MRTALPSETEATAMGRRVRRAFRTWAGVRVRFQTFYEHGHWWVRLIGRATEDDRTYDAVDASGGDAVDGFSFEEV
jgi:hypothetical protein